MSTPDRRGPELRIADSEREGAVRVLGEHYAAGRLTKEEFDERADAAWAAKTASGLWPLFVDLPRLGAAQPGPPPPSPPASHRPASPWPVATRAGWHHGSGATLVMVVLAAVVLLPHLPVLLLVLAAWALLGRPASRRGPGRRPTMGPPLHR